MTSEEHKSFDEKIIQTATSLVSFRHADIILLYAPIKSEIDVMPIFELAKEKGKKVAFPKCNTEERTMKFHFVDSLEELSPCAYGIREPSEDAPVYDPETTQGSALCFVPGLAFDVYGYRLGYGKGYYDRFLNNFCGLSIGITFDELKCKALPIEPTDISVDIIITDKESVKIK
jgi:5-formyltetrahydrofolate cyclo-ligase